MAYDLISNATWTYSKDGTLTHVPTGTSKVIDITANPALHTMLSARHWKNLGSKTVYSDNPADWVERKIKWNRASEDPPVLSIEQNIGAGDYVDYTVYLLEDAPDYASIFESMANIMNDGVLNGFTKVHIREMEKKRVTLWQKIGLLSGGVNGSSS